MKTENPEKCSPEAPFITVVMPVRNEERHIAGTLKQVLGQDYPSERFEVIVADGMSDDGTLGVIEELASRHNNLRAVSNPKRLSSAGRNAGFTNGRGDIFLVVDGHCHIGSKELLKDLARSFETSGAHCLGRPQPLDPPGLTRFQKAVALARSSKLGHSVNSLIYGDYEGYASPVSNGAAYTKEVFEKAGLIDESFDACEDVEFNYRVEKAGFKAYTSPKLTVRYYPRESLKALFRQMFRYGKGRFMLMRKHPGTISLEAFVPPAFLAGLFMLALFAVISSATGALRVGAAGLGLLYAVYASLVMAESLRISVKNGFSYFRHLPAIFIVIHAGLGAGFLTGALAGALGKR